MIRSSRFSTCLAALIFFSLCLVPAQARTVEDVEFLLTGKTMGTYYRIKFLARPDVSRALWEKKVKIRLKEVNARLSMYQKDSELSRFNRTREGRAFRVSSDFEKVLVRCRELYDLSHGAWDGTVKPLVDLWGFGTRETDHTLPEEADITQALQQVGFNKLKLKDRTLTKTAPGITLDLGSIAKGYGVDEIARLFREGGIKDCLVDIGGELAAFGKNSKGRHWVVGISKPEEKSLSAGIFGAVRLDNRAIATSGNYRNFFEINGKTYSHIIHPATGRPVDNQVVSASVIAPDCTLADGLATALMVMDPRESLDLVNTMAAIECLILTRDGDSITPLRSRGFAAFEVKP